MNTITTKLLRQLIRSLERIERNGIEPRQTQPDAEADSEEASAHSNRVQPPMRVVGEIDFPSTLKEQHRADQKQANRLQERNFVVQCLLCIFTAGAFGAAAYYANIAKGQLAEAHIQNVAQQRAVLTFDSPKFGFPPSLFTIRAKNVGRMPARITAWSVGYKQFVRAGSSFARNNAIKPGAIVTVEDPYLVTILLPSLPPTFLEIQLFASISYDDGFGNIQTASPCFRFQAETKEWHPDCPGYGAVDLSQNLPSDVVILGADTKK